MSDYPRIATGHNGERHIIRSAAEEPHPEDERNMGREAGPPSDRTRRPGETNAQYNMRQPEFRAANQLGDCKTCGRIQEHRWHTMAGPGTIGDGMGPHKYNPPRGVGGSHVPEFGSSLANGYDE